MKMILNMTHDTEGKEGRMLGDEGIRRLLSRNDAKIFFNPFEIPGVISRKQKYYSIIVHELQLEHLYVRQIKLVYLHCNHLLLQTG